MAGIYKRLRQMGHTIGHSLSEAFSYNVPLPFGTITPVEFHIEDSLGSLEKATDILSGTKYHPNFNTSKERIDQLVGYLNYQLDAEKTHDDVRFSQKQKARYDEALEKLAQAFPRSDQPNNPNNSQPNQTSSRNEWHRRIKFLRISFP